MARLVLNLLGTFQANLAGRPVDDFQYDKVRALLVYLAAESDRPHRREKLIGLLWPGYPESSARRNLTQALYNLRNALGDRDAKTPFLLVTPRTIQINLASDVQLDVDSFLAATERGELSDLEAAVTAYRGRFLSGLSLDDCLAFDEWVALRREALQQRAVAALHRLAELYEKAGQLRPALSMAQRQVALDPYWEEGRRTLMCLLAADGQRNAALAQYEELRELLDTELAVEPELATRALYEEIRSAREGVTLRSVLIRAGRDRRYQVRVVALVVLLGLSLALSVRLLMGRKGGPAPWDPRDVIEGVSMWPEIDLQPWATNPIIKPGTPGSWDERVFAPTVIDTGTRIVLYYTGAHDWPNGPIVIGYSRSPDRTGFARAASFNPRVVADGGGFDAWGVGMPVLLLDGLAYQLYYAGAETAPFNHGLAIGRATTDKPFASWRRDPEPVLEPGGPGEWDSCAVTPGSVIVNDGAHTLYYLGSSSDECNRWMVGLASSTDGIVWTKYDNPETEDAPFAESDPVFVPGDPGAWDGQNLSSVAVRRTGRGWEMFYTGEGPDSRQAIGYAWSTGGIRWHRHPDNPVLRPEDDPYATDALQVHDLTFDGSTYRLYYDYGLTNGLGIAEGSVKWPIVVDTTEDELNADGDCSLREAIEAANRDVAVDFCPAGLGADRVIVPGGSYRLMLGGVDGVNEDRNQTGDLDILDDLTLQGAGAELTLLDGNGIDRLLHNQGARLLLDGLTLTNGRAPFSGYGGGGLLNHNGSVMIKDCVISRNVASHGGGLANKAAAGAAATMALNNSRVINNTALRNGGGIIHLNYEGAVTSTLIMTISRSTIAGNRADGASPPMSGGGGGILSALHRQSDGSVAVLTIIDSTVSGNVAAGAGNLLMGNGGGIGIAAGDVTIINSTVSGNRAIGEGAASGFGGGIWVTPILSRANVTLLNSTVSDNMAVSGGGGLAAMSLACVCGETADPTGMCEVYLPHSPADPAVTLHNAIVASNQAPAGAACHACESLFLSKGHNLENRDDCHLDQVGDLKNTNPSLGPLADNGGPTRTHAPLAGSPVVDAARCSYMTDQRNYPRPVDHPDAPNVADGCDIGAVELRAD